MKLRAIAVLLFLSVSLLPPCVRSAAQETQEDSPQTDATVSPTDDIDVINAKIKQLEDGGTLYFSPGLYHFNKSLEIMNKSITLRGSESTQKEDVILTSDVQHTIQILGIYFEENSNFVVTIEGITVRNDYQPEQFFAEYFRRCVIKPYKWLHGLYSVTSPGDDLLRSASGEGDESNQEPLQSPPLINCAIKQCGGYLDVISCELSAPKGIAVNVVDNFPGRLSELPPAGELVPYVVDTSVKDSTICDSLTAIKTSRPLLLCDSIISNNKEGISLLAKSRGKIDNVQFTENGIGFSADDSSAASIGTCVFLGNNTAISSRGENCCLQVNQSRFEQNKANDISCLAGTLFALSCTHSGGEGNAYNCLSPNIFLSDTSIEGYPVGIHCPRHGACQARNVSIKDCTTGIRCFHTQPMLIQDSTITDCEQGVCYEIQDSDITPPFGRYERNSFTDTSTPWNIPSCPRTVHRRDNEPNQ